jgi:hypothetical protein
MGGKMNTIDINSVKGLLFLASTVIIFWMNVLLVINAQQGIRLTVIVFGISAVLYFFSFDYFYKQIKKKDDFKTSSEATQTEKKIIFLFVINACFLVSFILLIIFSSEGTVKGVVTSKTLKYGKFHQPRKWVINFGSNKYFDTDYQNGVVLLVGDKVTINVINSFLGVKYYKNKYIIKRGSELPIELSRWLSDWSYK